MSWCMKYCIEEGMDVGFDWIIIVWIGELMKDLKKYKEIYFIEE